MIDGIPYAMATPTRKHQKISMKLSLAFGNYLEGKDCEVYATPFSVRLNAEAADDTVTIPDLAVVCDSSKLDEKGCNGAPDLVVEILSPSTAKVDMVIKLNKYLEAGVREYWIVNPETDSLQAFILKDGNYVAKGYADRAIIPVHIFPDFQIELEKIFE